MGEITKGILIGAGGIILAALLTHLFRKLVRRDGPRLVADLVAVPFAAPWQMVAEFSKEAQEKLDKLGEPADYDKTQELRSLRRDVYDAAREYKRTINSIGSELRRIDGAMHLSISNKGDQPIEDVFLRVPSALYYRIADGAVEKVETEPARDPAIRIGTLAQGHDVRVSVWTFMDNAEYGWRWVEDVTLGHRNGVGTIRGFKVLRSRPLVAAIFFFDKHAVLTGILISALSGAACVLILSALYALPRALGIIIW